MVRYSPVTILVEAIKCYEEENDKNLHFFAFTELCISYFYIRYEQKIQLFTKFFIDIEAKIKNHKVDKMSLI